MILGIDPSLCATAIVKGDGKSHSVEVFSSTNVGDHVSGRILRYVNLVRSIEAWLCTETIEAIFIEQYAFNSIDASAKYAAEFGGLLRLMLTQLTAQIYEVAPTNLKKFATGKGRAKKPEMMRQLRATYGVRFKTDDEYDAYGLYRMGLIARELAEPLSPVQRHCVEVALGKHKVEKKPKKRRAKKKAAKKSIVAPPEKRLF